MRYTHVPDILKTLIAFAGLNMCRHTNANVEIINSIRCFFMINLKNIGEMN